MQIKKTPWQKNCSLRRQPASWLWVGFYWVKNDELVLAPFQGPIACTRIKFGRGVCEFVPDVKKFPGHIACSSSSVSEIVVGFTATCILLFST